MSLMSPKSEPTLASMDCAGVPARSTTCVTAVVTELVADEVKPVAEASQNINMTSVTPIDDQRAICLRVFSGLAFSFAMKFSMDIFCEIIYSFSKTTTSASLPSISFFFKVSFATGAGFSPASFKNTLSASFAPISP